MTTTENTHVLAARIQGVLVELEKFPSYDAALVAHKAATNVIARYPHVTEYVFRAIDDPHIVERFHDRPAKHYDGLVVLRALREWQRKEVGQTARAMIAKAEPGTTLHSIQREIKESLRARGFKPERWEVEQAVKSRVILGRVPDTRRAYWVAKKDGPLYLLSDPESGRPLNQTSLALNAEFRRLDLDAMHERNNREAARFDSPSSLAVSR